MEVDKYLSCILSVHTLDVVSLCHEVFNAKCLLLKWILDAESQQMNASLRTNSV